MFEQIKEWISRRGSVEAHHDLAHLPMPKRLGVLPELSQLRMVVLDLEMTGLNPSKDHVIAIGAVAIDCLQIPLRDQFDLVLRRPELDISETVLIHGIGPEALVRGHETEDALLYLLEWMNGDPILAFHSDFDQKFLEKTLKQTLGYKEPHIWLDVADLMPAMLNEAPKGGGRLDNWAEHCALEVSERHHAAADALATAELSLIALDRALKNDLITLEQVMERMRYHRRLKALHRQ